MNKVFVAPEYDNVRIVYEKYKIPLFNNISEITLKDLSSRL